MSQEERIHNLVEGIKTNQYPRYLYKYWSIKSAKRFLSTCQIMFSRYDSFNDPFECSYHLVGQYTDEYAARNLIVSLNEENNILAQQAASTMNADEIKTVIDNVIKESILSHLGLFCMTTEPTNLLMWAHYAKEHEGICLKYDLLKDPKSFVGLFKMNYSTGFMNIDYLNGQRDIVELLHHKSTDWMYENEYRCIRNEIGLVDVNPKALCEIIFGCRTSQMDKDDIKKIVMSNSKFEVLFKQAAMHTCDYKLLIIDEDDERIIRK